MNQNSGSVSDELNNEECSKKDKNLRMNEWILYAPAGLIATRQISFATVLGLFTLFLENILCIIKYCHTIYYLMFLTLEMKTSITNDLTSVHKSFNIV